jgi:hypothetical protein
MFTAHKRRLLAKSCRLTKHYNDPQVQASLLDTGSREDLIGWLCWNDPNGIWTDRDSEAEGYDPLTLDGAREAMQRALAQ